MGAFFLTSKDIEKARFFGSSDPVRDTINNMFDDTFGSGGRGWDDPYICYTEADGDEEYYDDVWNSGFGI